MNQSLNEKVIEALQIENLPKDMQNEIIAGLGEMALKNTLGEILVHLSVKEMDECEKLSKQGDLEALKYFLQKQVPDFDNLLQNEVKKVVADFKEELKSRKE